MRRVREKEEMSRAGCQQTQSTLSSPSSPSPPSLSSDVKQANKTQNKNYHTDKIDRNNGDVQYDLDIDNDFSFDKDRKPNAIKT